MTLKACILSPQHASHPKDRIQNSAKLHEFWLKKLKYSILFFKIDKTIKFERIKKSLDHFLEFWKLKKIAVVQIHRKFLLN